MTPEDREKRAKLRVQLHEIEATEPDPLPTAYAYVNNKEPAPQAYVLRMGDPKNRLDPVDPPCRACSKPPTKSRKSSVGTAHGARQLAGIGDNPLTARVMVNRIWQFRMGTGIVRTPNDFGVMGDRPSNQALLDWLAAEFVAKGWSVKAMDRLIVTSSVYRQSAQPDKQREPSRPRQSLVLAHESQTHGRRNHARRHSLGYRHSESAAGRPARAHSRSSRKSTI